MHGVRSWLSGRGPNANASTHSLNSLAESQNLEAAMRAATLIMNDDVDGAEAGLSTGNSSFHKLGRGVVCFIKATLGFEQDIMREAAERLADAETTASNDQHKAQREGKAFRSNIYDAGSEFALCHAQAQLMIAVVGVLNESLTESLRGFYKMRKAFFTLESLLEMENRHIKNRKSIGQSGSTKHSSESLRSTYSVISEKAMPGGFAERNKEQSSIQSRPDTSSPLHNAITPGDIKEAVEEKTDSIDATSGDEEDEFFDADDAIDDLPVAKTYTGHMDVRAVNGKLSDLSIAAEDHAKKEFSMSSPQPPPRTGTGLMLLDSGPESEVFSNPLDMFIHSGSNLCFGLMLLLISMIPPAFGKLLYIIGFKGDRERGIRMLWQASKFDNVNGGMAGLILLGWYNGLVGFCDIVPDSTGEVDDVEGYPAGRLEALLHEMRTRYPKSYLWLLEEARMNAQHRNLDTALEILSRENKSQLKQVAALHMFEKSLNSMYSHRYALCSESFLRCVELNSWSRALYYYNAGASHLALYRLLRDLDPKNASRHAKLAESHFRTAPSHAGKKKIMARQLPFDVFVNRKIQKWDARAKQFSCSFVDAVGVAPVEEMIYLWNGYKKMTAVQLTESLENLAWSESNKNPHWSKEGPDERAILSLLRAGLYRTLRRHDEAKNLLKQDILSKDRNLFKGQLRDDWTVPTAHYEMGVNLWMERTEFIKRNGMGPPLAGNMQKTDARDTVIDLEGDRGKVRECKDYIDKAAKWESYELDARIGMKVTTASDAIKKWETSHGPSMR